MGQLIVGQLYLNGKLSREITKIDGGEIYYKTEKGKNKNCWVTTFQDWVKKGEKEKSNETVSCKYEVAYTQNGTEYITTDNMADLKIAKNKAKKIKESKDVTDVKVMEFKTITKIIEV